MFVFDLPQKDLSQSLTQNNNMKLWKKEYEPKVASTTPYIWKEKWMDYQHPHSSITKH
jgi:hypothetical protein